MPVHKCPNGMYRIGKGKCIYKTKEAADRAYKAYLAKKHQNELNIKLEELKEFLEKIKND